MTESKFFPSLSLIKAVSYSLTISFCLVVLVYGLLPGLLAACLGYLFVDTLTGPRRTRGPKLRPGWAAAVVLVIPVLLLVLLSLNAKGMVLGALEQYQALLQHLSNTVLEIRQKLPPDLAGHIPDELTTVQTWLAEYLKTQASALTDAGKVWLQGSLLVYVGLVVGALIRATDKKLVAAPLRNEIRCRAGTFIEAFQQIIVAQFWIAAFNATATTVFLFIILPLFDTHIPYTLTLILLTFFSSLIPVVGNLMCNGVLTLAGVSVSPVVGLGCLIFLIIIHKFEYFINAKVVGTRTNTSAWELIAVMFIGEAIFGVPGLVSAPLLYAYAQKELHAAKLV